MIKYGSNMLKLQSRRLYHSYMWYMQLSWRGKIRVDICEATTWRRGGHVQRKVLKAGASCSEILDLRDFTLLDIVVNSGMYVIRYILPTTLGIIKPTTTKAEKQIMS